MNGKYLLDYTYWIKKQESFWILAYKCKYSYHGKAARSWSSNVLKCGETIFQALVY